MSCVKLINITKKFNNKKILNNINLDIREGEIISLLGKSGCGKSTTLKLIAGLITPDGGDILFNDESVLNLSTDKRDAVIVFQDYLLFPHMTVFENIEFGLKMRKVDKKIRREKVEELLKLVKLDGYENKYPHELSGGQNQRVAIARTLAVNPKILLLDEPFSNLDINLRNEMREFVLELQKRLGITTILVTHDKEEALMMSDRIAIMIDGEIKQFDKPQVLYNNPANKDVAHIFGERNFLKGKIINNTFINNIIELNINTDTEYKINDNVEIMIPIENIIISPINDNDKVYGTIMKKRYAGAKTYYHINVKGEVLKAVSKQDNFNIYEKVSVSIKEKNIVLLQNN